ncbi:hypothetical protein Y919_02980 [Caloranaerobacter azorensis H53214]|uniref:Transcobalamin-like C-terminal domain-containing protein n=1 Tax=Caloranaerobacter azorensis H53214 TaxID=1156417 RepID=A0A096CWX2_9FIRM|nr:DUF4430 domain-containing protein [Caloranaerobacter azorensis]KGG81039.1 hypothetical protein Y919_02980 [Caloranaerobacter azorensis H53214]
MKKSRLKKYISLLLIISISVVFIIGCGNDSKTKEITNIENKQENKQIKESEKAGNDNVVVIDGVKYKGYKGPVQGEVKYKEGTPADENSHDYKASGDIESPYHVKLIVTRDYGHKTIFCKNVGLVKDEVGMEVLFRNLDIQTAYGGGFVNAINGIESKFTFFTGKDRKKMDWFYWVNGILAPIGVAEYRPQPDDEIWWDYHDWSITMFIPAVIGSYPHPFINGFFGKNPGTVIMYTEDFKEGAEKLKKSLNDIGVKQVDIALFDPEAIKKPKKYYILVGVWNELAENSDVIKDINKKNKLIGVYVKFQDGKLYGLNFKGKVISTHNEAGAIFAYASSIGSIKPIWMVTGTNDKGVSMALDVLINNPDAIDRHFGAIISKDGVENIPYVD